MGVLYRRMGAALSILVLGGLTSLYAQSCSTVGSTTTCTAANGTVAVGGSQAESSPYPLTLAVPTLSGSIQKLTVTVNNLTTTSVASGGDFEIVLVSPHGEQLELLSQYCQDDVNISNRSLTFDDTVSTKVNSGIGSTSCSAVTSGTFHTTAASAFTNLPDSVPNLTLTSASIAQPKGTGTLAQNFAQSPGGTWSLYVAMNTGGYDTGTLGGAATPAWSLAITMNAASTPTTTTVSRTAGATPSFNGDSLTYTATVSPSPGAGTVQFFDNGSGIGGCGAQTVSGATATCTTTALAEGAHNITATYGGTAAFGGSTSAGIFQAVNNHTQVSGAGLSQSFCNNGAITLPTSGTAIAPAPASPYASEIFVSGMAGNLENLTLSLNSFTAPDPQEEGLLLVGPNGNTLDFFSYVGGSTSMSTRSFTIDDHGAGGLLQESVMPANGASYQPTSVTSGNATSYCTQSSVSGNICNGVLISEAPANAFVSATNRGAGTLLGQFGGISPNGTWQLFAVNRGGTGGTAQIGSWCLNITDTTGDATTTALASNTNPSFTGGSVTFTAAVTDTNSPSTPIGAGTLLFVDNGSTLSGCSAVAVSPQGGGGGKATCTTSTLTEGSHNIVAEYSGAAGFGPSNNSLTQIVNTPTTATVNGSTYTYCNPGGINTPMGQPGNALRGPSQPFPSNIFVSNLPGTLSQLTVSLNSFTFSHPDQLQSLLVGPAGTAAQSLDFLSQLNTVTPFGPNSSTINFTMSDAGSSLGGDPSPGGTFRPYSGAANNIYSSPAPSGPYQYAAPAGSQTFASVFGSGAANPFNATGTWSLYLENTTNGAVGSLGSWCLNLTENLPDLAIANTMTHSPATFKRGATGSFSMVVSNPNGPGPSGGTVTISDTLPTGLTFTTGSGTGWACSATGQVVTCTNSTPIAVGGSSTLTINFSVGNTTADTIVNSATLTGGGDSNASNNSAASGNISVLGTNLTINKTHTDPFVPGQTGATYTITVHNSGASGAGTGPGVTGGTITVTDSLPNVFTPTGFGSGAFTCQQVPTLSCTLNSSLAVGADATLTLTVNVGSGFSGSVTNTAILGASTDQLGADPVHHDDLTNIAGPPTITSPSTGTNTTNPSVTVSGTAVPAASVLIFDGGTQIATTSADVGGNFSSGISLAVGVHPLTAEQTVNGGTSGASNTVTVTISPLPPVITAPSNGFNTTNTSVTVSGTATANAAVSIFDAANQIGLTTADGGGNFSVLISLAVGMHSLTAKQTVNSLTSAASNTAGLTIAPLPPAITSPANGFNTTNTSVSVGGTAIAGASVSIFDGISQIGATTADGSGNFSLLVSLSAGVHSLTAKQTVNSVTSAASTAVGVTITPAAPAITAPANNTNTTNTSVTVSGTALANASVAIFDGANQIGLTTADGGGNFSTPVSLAVGVHSLTAKQTVNSVTSAASTAVSVTISPGAPSITAPANGFNTTNTSVTVSGTATANAAVSIFDGANQIGLTTADVGGNFSTLISLAVGVHSLTAKQTVNSITSAASSAVSVTIAPPAPTITSPTNGFNTTSTSVTVSGTATANASVSIFDGANQITATAADSSGNFSTPVSLAVGIHSLTAKQTVNSVASAASSAVGVTITPLPPAITSPTTGLSTANTSPTVSGTATAGASVTIFDAGSLIATTTADGSGNFSTTVSLALGGHTLTAKQTVNSVTSAASNTVGVTIVPKTTPTVTWNNPADITFGSALSSEQLNATASVPGTFVYTPPAGTVLQAGSGQTLSVMFTPTDTIDYNSVSKNVLINDIATAGPPNLVTTRTLSRDVNNDVLVTLAIANTGGSTASNVQLNSAAIGAAATTTPLPQVVGNIPGGGSLSITIRFAAASVGAPGTAAVLSFAGTYTGNSFGGSSRITLP